MAEVKVAVLFADGSDELDAMDVWQALRRWQALTSHTVVIRSVSLDGAPVTLGHGASVKVAAALDPRWPDALIVLRVHRHSKQGRDLLSAVQGVTAVVLIAGGHATGREVALSLVRLHDSPVVSEEVERATGPGVTASAERDRMSARQHPVPSPSHTGPDDR